MNIAIRSLLLSSSDLTFAPVTSQWKSVCSITCFSCFTRTGFFANIRFKSYLLNTFSSCLQSKEILFVQQRFRYSFAAERKNRAPQQPIDRSEARFFNITPVFCPERKKKPLLSWQTKEVSFMAGSANFEDTTKPNQSPAAGGFDSERRSSGVSARWLLMQSIKSRRKRYEACDDVAGSANFEDSENNRYQNAILH